MHEIKFIGNIDFKVPDNIREDVLNRMPKDFLIKYVNHNSVDLYEMCRPLPKVTELPKAEEQKTLVLHKAPAPWTKEQKESLSKIYPWETKENIMRAFPQRSWGTIQDMAYQMKIKRLTNEKKAMVAATIKGEI